MFSLRAAKNGSNLPKNYHTTALPINFPLNSVKRASNIAAAAKQAALHAPIQTAENIASTLDLSVAARSCSRINPQENSSIIPEGHHILNTGTSYVQVTTGIVQASDTPMKACKLPASTQNKALLSPHTFGTSLTHGSLSPMWQCSQEPYRAFKVFTAAKLI